MAGKPARPKLPKLPNMPAMPGVGASMKPGGVKAPALKATLPTRKKP